MGEKEEVAVHGLFVPAAGAVPAEVEWIVVRRCDGGQWKTHVRTFPASEIADAESLVGQFGGGDYELIGLAGPPHARRETVRRRESFAGPWKPLGAGDHQAGQVQPVAAAPSGGGNEVLVALINSQATTNAALMTAIAGGRGLDPGLVALVSPVVEKLVSGGSGGFGVKELKDVLALVNGAGVLGGGIGERAVVGLVEGVGRALNVHADVQQRKVSGPEQVQRGAPAGKTVQAGGRELVPVEFVPHPTVEGAYVPRGFVGGGAKDAPGPEAGGPPGPALGVVQGGKEK